MELSPATVRHVMRTLAYLGARPSDVEDLAQETLMVAFAHRATFDASRRLEPWLMAIARNVLRNHQRLVVHEREVQADVGEHGEFANLGLQGTNDQAEPQLNRLMLRTAIAGLPSMLQDVVILHELDGLTVAECAEALGVATDTIKDRLKRARHELRKAMGGVGATPTPGSASRGAMPGYAQGGHHG